MSPSEQIYSLVFDLNEETLAVTDFSVYQQYDNDKLEEIVLTIYFYDSNKSFDYTGSNFIQ